MTRSDDPQFGLANGVAFRYALPPQSPASTGTVEGAARHVRSRRDLQRLQPLAGCLHRPEAAQSLIAPKIPRDFFKLLGINRPPLPLQAVRTSCNPKFSAHAEDCTLIQLSCHVRQLPGGAARRLIALLSEFRDLESLGSYQGAAIGDATAWTIALDTF